MQIFRVKVKILKWWGYRLRSVVRYEMHDGTAITEGIYRHPSGREVHIIVERWVAKNDMQ